MQQWMIATRTGAMKRKTTNGRKRVEMMKNGPSKPMMGGVSKLKRNKKKS